MNLLILGATGRTGGHVVKAANDAGHTTTAFGRNEALGADSNLVGAFGSPHFVQAVQDADAVLSCLASSNKEPVCSRATSAVLAADPTARFITVAGAGVDRPTDAKGFSDKAIGLIMRVFVGPMLADRQREVDMLATSDARWTVLRPPRLVDGKAKGHWTFTNDRPAASWIDRKDLAGAMLATLDDPVMIAKAPFVSAKP